MKLTNNVWFTLVLVLCAYIVWQDYLTGVQYAPRPVTARGDLAMDEKTTIELFENAAPSVVYITSTSLAVKRDFFSFNVYKIPKKGTGSGFVWDKHGHIITNYHVIQGAQGAEVTLNDKSTWKAQLIGVTPEKDLAVLRIKAPKNRLYPLNLGTSHDLKVGQKVFAIGNPFGLDHTLTTGVISGLGREIQSVDRQPIQDVIQTDAAINPGNSGGPLLDSAGRLIGINTAIFSPSGAYAGVGFAVPVNTVNRYIPQLISYGKVLRPGFGVRIAQDYLTRRLGLKGVLVMDVLPGSAAQAAGMRSTYRDNLGEIILGDLIIAVEEVPIGNREDLYKALDKYDVGNKVRVTVQRYDGSTTKLPIVLQNIK